MKMKATILILAILGLSITGCRLTQIFGRQSPRELYLEQLLQVENSNPHAQFLAAKRLIGQGKGELAEQHLKQALKANPKRPEFHIGLGAAYEEQEEWGKAEKAYQKALELNPNSGQTQIRLGRLALRSNNLGKAKEWLSRASQQDDSANLWRLRGEIAYVSLDYAQALQAWQESLKRDPAQPILEELTADLDEYLREGSEEIANIQ